MGVPDKRSRRIVGSCPMATEVFVLSFFKPESSAIGFYLKLSVYLSLWWSTLNDVLRHKRPDLSDSREACQDEDEGIRKTLLGFSTARVYVKQRSLSNCLAFHLWDVITILT